jgi:hypothetical protein
MTRGAHLQGDAVLESASAELLDEGLIQRHATDRGRAPPGGEPACFGSHGDTRIAGAKENAVAAE